MAKVVRTKKTSKDEYPPFTTEELKTIFEGFEHNAETREEYLKLYGETGEYAIKNTPVTKLKKLNSGYGISGISNMIKDEYIELMNKRYEASTEDEPTLIKNTKSATKSSSSKSELISDEWKEKIELLKKIKKDGGLDLNELKQVATDLEIPVKGKNRQTLKQEILASYRKIIEEELNESKGKNVEFGLLVYFALLMNLKGVESMDQYSLLLGINAALEDEDPTEFDSERPYKPTQDSEHPNAYSLETLKKLAQIKGIVGTAKMSKEQLFNALIKSVGKGSPSKDRGRSRSSSPTKSKTSPSKAKISPDKTVTYKPNFIRKTTHYKGYSTTTIKPKSKSPSPTRVKKNPSMPAAVSDAKTSGSKPRIIRTSGTNSSTITNKSSLPSMVKGVKYSPSRNCDTYTVDELRTLCKKYKVGYTEYTIKSDLCDKLVKARTRYMMDKLDEFFKIRECKDRTVDELRNFGEKYGIKDAKNKSVKELFSLLTHLYHYKLFASRLKKHGLDSDSINKCLSDEPFGDNISQFTYRQLKSIAASFADIFPDMLDNIEHKTKLEREVNIFHDEYFIKILDTNVPEDKQDILRKSQTIATLIEMITKEDSLLMNLSPSKSLKTSPKSKNNYPDMLSELADLNLDDFDNDLDLPTNTEYKTSPKDYPKHKVITKFSPLKEIPSETISGVIKLLDRLKNDGEIYIKSNNGDTFGYISTLTVLKYIDGTEIDTKDENFENMESYGYMEFNPLLESEKSITNRLMNAKQNNLLTYKRLQEKLEEHARYRVDLINSDDVVFAGIKTGYVTKSPVKLLKEE